MGFADFDFDELVTVKTVNLNTEYDVILYNDNTTSFEFVIGILINLFDFSAQDATDKALTAHTKGKAIVGRYPEKLAMVRVAHAISHAKSQGYNDFLMKVVKA